MLIHLISERERALCFRTSQFYRLRNGKNTVRSTWNQLAQMFDIVHVLFSTTTRFRLHTIPQTRVLSGPTYVSSLAQKNSNKQDHFSIVSQKTSSQRYNSASQLRHPLELQSESIRIRSLKV